MKQVPDGQTSRASRNRALVASLWSPDVVRHYPRHSAGEQECQSSKAEASKEQVVGSEEGREHTDSEMVEGEYARASFSKTSKGQRLATPAQIHRSSATDGASEELEVDEDEEDSAGAVDGGEHGAELDSDAVAMPDPHRATVSAVAQNRPDRGPSAKTRTTLASPILWRRRQYVERTAPAQQVSHED